MKSHELIEKFSKVTVLIVGDIMLDQYWWGSVERISPEAPVPVVKLSEITLSAGGAANVAANVAGLGATPLLVGVVGNDHDSRNLFDHLAAGGISTDHIHILDRPTAVKTRIVAHNQHVVRVDNEKTHPLSKDQEDLVIDRVTDLLPSADVVILSDYAKGFLTLKIVESVIEAAKSSGTLVLVDPKGRDYSKYRGASVLTPNRREAADACNISVDQEDVVENAGSKLLAQLGLDAVIITEGEHGMTVFEAGRTPVNLPAQAHEIFDVTGAGDTVSASLAVAMASGIHCLEAVKLANIAAGLVVEQVGTSAITVERLIDKIDN
jgi:D-beta-D-heptose 7-phosphate kinase/D-beta-D-heptose 1-phosphate adenosyltransferase